MARGRYKRGNEGSTVGPGGGRGQGHSGYQGPWRNVPGQGPPPGTATWNPDGAGDGGGNGGAPPPLDPTQPAGGGVGATLDFDPALQRYLSGIQRQSDVAQGAAGHELTGLYQENFDPSNPFSNQALLERHLRQGHAENLLQMSSGGHLYSGAVEGREKEMAFTDAQQRDELQRAYMDAVSGIQGGLAETLSGYGQDAEGAIFDSASQQAADVSVYAPGYLKKKKHQGKGK